MNNSFLLKTLAVGFIASACCLAPQFISAAAYIKIGDIKGESRLSPGAIDLQSYELSVDTDREVEEPKKKKKKKQQEAPPSPYAVGHHDIVVTKEIDKSTPLLYSACVNGTPIPSAILTWGDPHEKADRVDATNTTIDGKPPEVSGRYELKNVLISSFTASGATGQDGRQMEAYKLSFSDIKCVFITPDADGNTTETTVEWRDAASGLPTGKR